MDSSLSSLLLAVGLIVPAVAGWWLWGRLRQRWRAPRGTPSFLIRQAVTVDPTGKGGGRASVVAVHVLMQTEPVRCVSWSGDGRRLASASGKRVEVWSVKGGRIVFTFLGHTDVVRVVRWSPERRYACLASGGDDRTLCAWRFSPGGSSRSWGIRTRWEVYGVSWSPDGTQLATASDERLSLYRHDRVEWSPGGQVFLGRNSTQLRLVAWSPDGKYVASAPWDDSFLNALYITEVTTGRPVAVYRDMHAVMNAVAWSPGGERLAVAYGDGDVRVWRALSGGSLPGGLPHFVWESLITCRGHVGSANGISWFPDGRWLASVGDDATLRVWDAASGVELLRVNLDTRILSVAVSPDGNCIAAGTLDRHLQLIPVPFLQ